MKFTVSPLQIIVSEAENFTLISVIFIVKGALLIEVAAVSSIAPEDNNVPEPTNVNGVPSMVEALV